jgi:hypothetical protein
VDVFKGGFVQTAMNKAFFKKIFSYEYSAILAVLAVCLLVGAFTVRDYGETWDEHDAYRYGSYALNAYQNFFHPRALTPFDTNLNLYGPAYFMFADLSSKVLQVIVPAWTYINADHFINFVVFLAGVWVFYLLVRRWVGRWAAFGASLLFLLQPLFWGHAFINPKDIPFLVAFMTGIYLGFRMIDVSATKSGIVYALLAGFMLGLTVTLRVVGPLAGLIVLAYALFNFRLKLVWRLVPYLLIALAVAYFVWPYLWVSPITRYRESFQTMAQFPFTGRVLFMGRSYVPKNLPWTYFPTLVSLQLTEPALLLALAGLIFLLVTLSSRKSLEVFLLFLAWFLFPILGIILIHSILYDNGRQLYFLLPPLFFLAAVALDRLFRLLNRPVIAFGLMALVLLSSIYACVRLHPYEYVYYNIFVNGTGGAFRSYEMDYWGTSFTEAIEDVNRIAPQHAKVLVFGPKIIARAYARPDLDVVVPLEGDTPEKQYDYAILLNRHNLDENHCRQAETVITIERKGAVFASIKHVAPGVPCQ